MERHTLLPIVRRHLENECNVQVNSKDLLYFVENDDDDDHVLLYESIHQGLLVKHHCELYVCGDDDDDDDDIEQALAVHRSLARLEYRLERRNVDRSL